MAGNANMLMVNLAGETFLQKLKRAGELADEVDSFQDWIVAGSAREEIVEKIKLNPVVAEDELVIGGLATLLGSIQERDQMYELVQEARKLDIAGYLGYQATVTAHQRLNGGIRKAAVANPIATGSMYLSPGASFRKKVSARLTSVNPAARSFRVGEYRSLRNPLRMTAFWEIHPFDRETGEPIVDLDIDGDKAPLPTKQYQLRWDANRA